jgi:ABC-type glycerol-3-phosphate transport system substrate-binding protein
VPALLLAALVGPAVPVLAAHRAAAQPVTIQIWDTNGNISLSTFVDKSFHQFETSHPGITLKLVHGQSLQKDLTAIAGGAGPDLVWLWDGNQPIGSWAAAGALQPIDQYMAATHYKIGQLIAAGVTSVSWHGRLWGLPLIADTFWLFYNMNDFRAAGLDPKKPPRTLDEALADAQKLTKRTGSGRILRLGYVLPGYGTPALINGQDVCLYCSVFGASLFNADGTKVTPDAPPVLAVWKELTNEWALYNKLYGHNALLRWKASLKGTDNGTQDDFLQDRFAMYIDGDWETQAVRDWKSSWKYGVDYAVAPIPYPAGYARYANRGAWVTYPLVMSSRAAHPREAWTFMEWAAQPAETAALAAFLNDLPPSKAALDVPTVAGVPGIGDLVKALPELTLVSETTSPISEQYYSAMMSYNDAIVNGQTTPEAAMKAVRATIQPQLDKQLSGKQ